MKNVRKWPNITMKFKPQHPSCVNFRKSTYLLHAVVSTTINQITLGLTLYLLLGSMLSLT